MKASMMTTWMGMAVCSAALLMGCEPQNQPGGEGEVTDRDVEVEGNRVIEEETRVNEQNGQTTVTETRRERDLTADEPGETAVEEEVEERVYTDEPQPEGGM